MAVEFLTDAEAAAYGRFTGPPTQAELEKVFFLDDADKALISRRRGQHVKLGFALQLTTVRYLGVFLEDPLDVPGNVLDYLAEQLDVDDPSCVKRYTERRTTPFDHQDEIKKIYELKAFEMAEAALRESNERLWAVLCDTLSSRQRIVLDTLLEVPQGKRVSDLERWRKGPAKASGKSMVEALERISEIHSVGMASIDVGSVVPHRRLVEFARYGMAAKAPLLRRHGPLRKLATLLATVRYLESKSVDDALELLDLLVTAELVGRAETETNKQRVKRHPKLAGASATLAVAVETLFEVTDYGEEEITLDQVWEAIDAIVSRRELRAAVDAVADMVPPHDVDLDGEMRAKLAERISTVSGFLKLLPATIEFDATPREPPCWRR